MFFKHALTLAAFAICSASFVQADISARFIEGAPKDRFEITSTSDCLSGPVKVTINLDGSAGGLIFDTTAAGAGVEVFQPFELTSGGSLVEQSPSVMDGDKALSIGLSALPKGQTVAFTLDVDDTGGAREITVNGGEIAGASVVLMADGERKAATFGADAKAVLANSGCNS
ncbi:aggregation factor core [Planktotalea sp.]|uniref:aggregation factor core n=1 Tax=Planktotalea sp. TaxID=2029877 RepID=UPI003F6B9789